MEVLVTNVSSAHQPLPSALTPGPMNCSAWDQQWGSPYLHRVAHLDVQLYEDFYAVWISLMVRGHRMHANFCFIHFISFFIQIFQEIKM